MADTPGKLYIVGTPLGNLGDFSPRAAETLRAVDFIAAEDTRVSIKLLNHFGIKKPVVSYYEHNSRESGQRILARLLSGESCAVVTDAGMPCISDPGEDLVRLCAENGVEVIAVPGPSAFVAALALSGFPTGRFCFEGFLSVKKSSRASHLDSIKSDTRTLIFYEAPHKLQATLEDMLEALGDRKIAIARELTKLHEEVMRTTLSEAVRYYAVTAPRGEFVLVIEGAMEKAAETATLEEAAEIARELMSGGISASSAAKEAAKLTGLKKGDIYKAIIDN